MSMSTSTRVSTLRALMVKLGYSRGIADHISTNLRASSVGCYESHWSRFVEYCREMCRINWLSVSYSKLVFSQRRKHIPESTVECNNAFLAHEVQAIFCFLLGLCSSGTARRYPCCCLLAFCRGLSWIVPAWHVLHFSRIVHSGSCHGCTVYCLYMPAVNVPTFHILNNQATPVRST